MRKFNLKIGAAALAVAAIATSMTTGANAATTIDLTSDGFHDTDGIATYQQINPQSTGTGVIDSFLRVQANGNEKGFNTDATPPFDAKGGGFTRDITLSSVPIVLVNGVPNYQFLLDINQTSSNPLLSLNQVEIFLAPSGNKVEADATLGLNGHLDSLAGATLKYDLNSAGTHNTYVVALNYALNPGSGAGDMFLYVPELTLGTDGTKNVILYSQFGNPPGDNATNDGIEEWATLGTSAVPEPTTMIAGALLLLPFGASTLRVLRNRKA